MAVARGRSRSGPVMRKHTKSSDVHGQLLVNGVPHAEAALIGNFGKFQIVVYGSEGRARPHFHIITGDRLNPDWQCCLCIRSARYFHGHEWKGGPLTPRQIDEMVAVLRAPSWAFRGQTAWESVVMDWNACNTDRKIRPNRPMPYYRALNENLYTGWIGGPFPGHHVTVEDYEGRRPPHFHILKTSRLKRVDPDLSITIQDLRILVDHSRKGAMSEDQDKRLRVFMAKPSKPNYRLTNWQAIVAVWNLCNPNRKVRSDLPMPTARIRGPRARSVAGLRKTESSRVGWYGRTILYVCETEDPVPHFHLIQGDPESPSWQSSIRIDRAEYHSHLRAERLTSKERRQLVAFLKVPDRFAADRTLWKTLLITWNRGNPSHRLRLDTEMPDYRKLL
jgi:hypothetical protein